MRLIRRVPLSLTIARALIAPVVVLGALYHPSPTLFAGCLIFALVSDVFDGIIARRLGIATPRLRRMDSVADTIFYVSALFAAWHLHAAELRRHLAPIVVLLLLEMARYAFDYLKFRREASYHMWSSKFWGLTLFFAFFMLLARNTGGWPLSLAIYAGIAADIEGFAISLILRAWRADVPSFVHAMRLRGGN